MLAAVAQTIGVMFVCTVVTLWHFRSGKKASKNKRRLQSISHVKSSSSGWGKEHYIYPLRGFQRGGGNGGTRWTFYYLQLLRWGDDNVVVSEHNEQINASVRYWSKRMTLPPMARSHSALRVDGCALTATKTCHWCGHEP